MEHMTPVILLTDAYIANGSVTVGKYQILVATQIWQLRYVQDFYKEERPGHLTAETQRPMYATGLSR